MRREPLSREATLACADQAHRALAKSALVGVPASILLAAILGSSVPLSRRVVFVLLVSAADVVTFVASTSYLRSRTRGESVRSSWVGVCCIGAIGAAWGSLAVIGLPDVNAVELRAVYLLFVCGTSATYVVGAAARRLYYYASQIPMLSLVFVGFVASGDRVTRMLGLAVPIYFLVMTALHNEVHGVVVSELQLRERNADSNVRLREANARLRQRALRDDLTGLPNRAAFSEALEGALERAKVTGMVTGVLYVDVDRFKVINDSRGHGVGDALLRDVAHKMRGALGESDLLARVGGDEFVALVGPEDTPKAVVAAASRLREAVTDPFMIQGRQVHVSLSIGIATTSAGEDDADTLLSHADAAQYRAKQAGGDAVEEFDVLLRDRIQRRFDDEQDLRVAIRSAQIMAWFQPVISLHNGNIVGAEALARWQHPTRGVLDGSRFVPLAEEAGLVVALDEHVVRQALQARGALATAGAVDKNFRIWCNVHASQFARSNPTERLANLLDELGCDAELLGIEITETAILGT
jgi:diguanylate cyclase (GGDEF)-like protein